MNQDFDTTPIRIIACGALAREILAVGELNELTQLDVKCLPAIWHNHPEKIAPGVKQAISEAREDGFSRIFVAYADCGTGGLLDVVCDEAGVERLSGPHCYSFFAGNDLFATKWDEDMTSFFLTDFLARQFDTFITKPYKLEKHPELIEMMFHRYTKLIYLAQTEDEQLQADAKRAANFLGLDYEYSYKGYVDLNYEMLTAAQNQL
jgi:hypothetical protein